MLIKDLSPRNQKWHSFAEQVGVTSQQSQTETQMLDVFRRLWNCEVLNRMKEPFWRLVYDSIPTPARVHLPHLSCSCGSSNPDRNHYFWDCTIFQEMVSYIQSKTGKVVTKEMVWMVHPPETIYIRVWEVLVLGMIYSREHIRRRECRLERERLSLQ